MSAALDALVGCLRLAPGADMPIRCDRPMVGATMMQRLANGRRTSLLPDLMAAVFTQCAGGQRVTSPRAVRAAFGQHNHDQTRGFEVLALRLAMLREHLQRLSLDRPIGLPRDTAPPAPGWLRDAPVLALPALPAPHDRPRLEAAAAAMPGWLDSHLTGLPLAEWLHRWHAGGTAWVATWCRGRDQPVARWLAAVHDEAQTVAWPCRPLPLPGATAAAAEPALNALAGDLARDPDFAERPVWQGQPAETGPWTSLQRPGEVLSAWDRLASRLADAVALAHGRAPSFGALTVRPGEGLAWTELSRGVLVHWVRLDRAAPVDTARAEVYRVLAPTEWNFHPAGGFGQALGRGGLTPAQAALGAASMDPCLRLKVATNA